MGLNLGSLAGYMFSGFAVKYNMYSLTTIILGFFFIVIVLLMWALNKGKARLLFTMRKSLLLYMTVAVFSIWVIFLFSMQLKNIISLACIILLLSVFLFSLRELKKNRIVARNLFILGILTLVSVVYWTIYKMQDSLFLIFFVHHVNRDVLGFTIPAPSLLSINPIVILLFGPILSLFWIKTGKRFNQPTHKVFFGVAIFAVAFIPVIIALKTQLPISIGSVVLFVAIISFSELALGPGTISMVGQLAQEKYQMFLLGLVQLSTSLASIFSAQLSVMLHDDFLTAQYPLSIGYEKVFFILSIILVVSAMFVLLLRKVVRYEA